MDIFQAARAGDVDAVRRLMPSREEIEAKDSRGQTALICAAEGGHIEVLRALLDAGAAIDGRAGTPEGPPSTPAEPGLEVIALDAGAEAREQIGGLVGRIIDAEAERQRERHAYGGRTALMAAAEGGHVAALNLLIERGATIELREDDGYTALALATVAGQVGAVRTLLAAGANPNRQINDGSTPLYLATLMGRDEVVPLLLEAGARPNRRGPMKTTALHVAAREGSAAIARALLAAGADLEAQDTFNNTPLIHAIRQGRADLARLLIAAGADLTRSSPDGTPLLLAAEQGEAAIVRALLDAGADVEVRSGEGLTPLMVAARRGHAEVVRLLLAAGADIRARAGAGGEDAPVRLGRAERGSTALSFAARSGHAAVVADLLAAGAEVDARDDLRRSPLVLALRGGHEEAARRLREAGAVEDGAREIPLVEAAQRGDVAQVRALLAAGTDVDARSELEHLGGRTPLMAATEGGHLDVMRVLLDAGADVSVGSQGQRFHAWGGTALWRAAERGDRAACQLLLDHGANPLADEFRVDTGCDEPPLLMAARRGDPGILAAMLDALPAGDRADAAGRALREAAGAGQAALVRALLDRGTPADAPGSTRRTALMEAAAGGHAGIVDMLLGAGADPSRQARGGDTAPGLASLRGHDDIVERLARAGGDVASSRRHDPTLLIDATRRGDIDRMRKLIEAGADVNAAEQDGRTPLLWAVAMGRLEAVRLLLDHGADVNTAADGLDGEGITPLMRAAADGRGALVDLLTDAGADLEARDRAGGRTPLMHAAAQDRADVIRQLLARGADLEACDEAAGRTALMIAAVEGKPAAVRALIEAGADLHAEDLDGQTAAGLAARQKQHATGRLLQQAMVGGTRPGPSPVGALSRAAEKGDAGAIRELARQGVDINVRLAEGRTPLMVAAERGHAAAVEALIEAGADPNGHDRGGSTPLIHAIRGRNPAAVRHLLRAGADPNARGTTISGLGSETPLAVAIGERCTAMTNAWQDVVNGFSDAYTLGPELLEIVRALIEAGADIDAPDELGNRPLTYALDTGQVELADLLAEAGAGREPIGATYLQARRLAELVRGDDFQESIRRLAALCGAGPEPLTSRPTHREFATLRRGGTFPTGTTIGARFTVHREQAEALIATYQEEFRRRGAFLFRCETIADDWLSPRFDINRQRLGLVPTDDKYVAIAAVCSAGSDWGWVSPALYIRDLRAIERDFPFALIGCEPHSLELRFDEPIADVADLVRRLTAIRTSLSGPGLPEHPDPEDVAAALRRHPRIRFDWE